MRVEDRNFQDMSINMALQELRTIEQKVKAHEMAHKAVGGQYAGQVSYNYTLGPDGKLYITGGEVSIDTSEEKTPEETIKKMQVIRAAALAPMDPSPQDYRVAALATMKEMKARIELTKGQDQAQILDIRI